MTDKDTKGNTLAHEVLKCAEMYRDDSVTDKEILDNIENLEDLARQAICSDDAVYDPAEDDQSWQ